jgi:hypothetical protein
MRVEFLKFIIHSNNTKFKQIIYKILFLLNVRIMQKLNNNKNISVSYTSVKYNKNINNTNKFENIKIGLFFFTINKVSSTHYTDFTWNLKKMV